MNPEATTGEGTIPEEQLGQYTLFTAEILGEAS
jgi:hypothetical protein